MSKQEQDLLHYQNKCHQLTQLLESEREKNKALKRVIAEVSFTGKALMRKLEKVE